ncbi:unnamed protein product [Blepharisma stoltei]|uniref:Uncharacterized protein n=1 Tax=Blepharisma stoltei TaxID=1481888 RepID=A0AAU9KBL6_9CILI|nr:unnamed protein product [Blepharisma stoltei]
MMSLPEIIRSKSVEKEIKNPKLSNLKHQITNFNVNTSLEISRLNQTMNEDDNLPSLNHSSPKILRFSPISQTARDKGKEPKTPRANKLKYIINSIPASIKEKYDLPIIPTDHSWERIVGTVTYRTYTPLEGPSFQFSTTPRFDTPLFHQIESFKYRYVSEERKKEIKVRIRQNKDVSRFSPEKYKEILKEKFKMKALKEINCKENKTAIDLNNKKLREDHYNGRLRRIEIRNNWQEFHIMKKSWILLFTAISFATIWKKRGIWKKKLKERNKSIINWLFQVCLVLGKFRIKIREARSKLAWSKMKNYLTPHILAWKFRKNKRFKEIITDVLSRGLDRDNLQDVVNEWKRRISLIQKGFISMINIYRARTEALMNLWNKTEEQLTKKNKKNIFISQEEDEEFTGKRLIPRLVKLYFIRKFLNAKLSMHGKALAQYFDECKKHEETFMEKFADSVLYGKKVKLEDVYVAKPSFVIFSEHEEFVDIIKTAYKEKDHWEQIIVSETKVDGRYAAPPYHIDDLIKIKPKNKKKHKKKHKTKIEHH